MPFILTIIFYTLMGNYPQKPRAPKICLSMHKREAQRPWTLYPLSTGHVRWALDVCGYGHHAETCSRKEVKKLGKCTVLPTVVSCCSTWREHSHFLNKYPKTRQGSELDSQLVPMVSASCHPVLPSLSWPQKGMYLPAGADHHDTQRHNSRSNPSLLPELRRGRFWPPEIKIMRELQQILNSHFDFLLA